MRYICKAQPYAVLVRAISCRGCLFRDFILKDICAGMNQLLTGLVLLIFALLCFAYFKDVALYCLLVYIIYPRRNLLLPTSLFLCSQFVIFPLADF